MKITRRQLRQIITETLLTEKNENPSWNLFQYTGDVWQNLETSIPGTRDQSELASSVRDIYTSISSAVMAFAALYDTGTDPGKVNIAVVNRNIDRAISELEKIRSVATKQPDEIALFTGDSIFDASKVKFKSAIADIEVEDAADIEVEDDDAPQLASPKR